MSDKPVLLVSATRGSEEEFLKMPLGLSLNNLMQRRNLKPAIAINNKDGLPSVYNSFITEAIRGAFVVFVHDDVWIDDFFFTDHLQDALSRFDVIGVVGNARPHPNDTQAWHIDLDNELDADNLSGALCICQNALDHENRPLNYYGKSPAAASLLDGVFIAARGDALLDKGLRFDERFDFHYYDLDFSRAANESGLKVGTWPIAITHVMKGDNSFATPEWRKNRAAYFEKWLGADHLLAQTPPV